VKESGLTVRMGKAGEELVLANSPLRMMALKAKTGEQLVVEVDTDDQGVADALFAQIQEFLKG
jgi:phosphotransferase system HPr-like phosphotransfer protein